MTTTARTRQLIIGTPKPIRAPHTRVDLIKSLTIGGVASLLVGALYVGWLIHGRDTAALDPQIAASERYWAEVMSNSAYGVIAIFLGGLALIAAAHIQLGNRQHQQRLAAVAGIRRRVDEVGAQVDRVGSIVATLAEVYLQLSGRVEVVEQERAQEARVTSAQRLPPIDLLDAELRGYLARTTDGDDPPEVVA